MITKQHIENAITATVAGKSSLTHSAFQVRGFSTPHIRMLVNNLCNIEGTYLEVGVLCGASFISSFNPNLVSIGIEDFSENFTADFPNYDKEELENNIWNHYPRAKEVKMIYQPYFEVEKSELPDNIDIYFYDGEHGLNNSTRALPEMFDKMADKFLFIVDDINWQLVREGVGLGLDILKNKMEVEVCYLLGKDCLEDPIWNNGVALFLINKKK
jgi:hypothetical protein